MELLSPEGMLDGIKALGIDDLTEKEVNYLVRVLGKEEIDGNIVMQEFYQIMENLGIYEYADAHGYDDDEVTEAALQQMIDD